MDPFRSQGGYNQGGAGYQQQGGDQWRGQQGYGAQSPSSQQGYGNWRGSGGGQNNGGGGGGGNQQAPPNRMYVGNLLYTAQPQDVTTFFESNGFKVANIQISIDPMTGRNPSYCFVDFESTEEAQRAKNQLNGGEILGRPVKINEGSHRRQSSNAQGLRVNSQGGGWNNMYGGPANQNFSPTGWGGNQGGQWGNQQQHHPKRLYVGGLPHMDPQDYVESELKKLFQGYQVEVIGKLISPLPSQQPDDSSDRYYLFVDLVNQSDVDKAIEQLNNTQSPWGQRGPLKVGRARNNMGRKQQGGGGHNQGGYGGGYGGQMQMP